MSSILRLDKIELPNGNVPRAEDVGLNVAGTVVQVKQANFNIGAGASLASTSSQSFVSTPMTITFTPKYANSILYITAATNLNMNTTTNNGIVGAIYRDGVNIQSDGGYNGGMFIYTNPVNDHYPYLETKEYVNANTTNATTFTLWVRCWNAANIRIGAHAGKSYMTVMEVAQ